MSVDLVVSDIKTGKRKRGKEERYNSWCATVWLFDEMNINLAKGKEWFKSMNIDWIYGEDETGVNPADGKNGRHWQICGHSNNIGRAKLQEALGAPNPKCYSIHVEKMISLKGSLEYCHKRDPSTTNMFELGVRPHQGFDNGIYSVLDELKKGVTIEDLFVIEPALVNRYRSSLKDYVLDLDRKQVPDDLVLDNHEPHEWQQRIMHICNGPVDDRKIHWIYDPFYGAGKSALCSWLIAHKSATEVGGKYSNIAEMYQKQPIVIFDVAGDEGAKHISYKAMEHFKDGKLVCEKYQSRTKIFKRPHVLVFSNEMPYRDSRIDHKRFIITELDKHANIVHKETIFTCNNKKVPKPDVANRMNGCHCFNVNCTCLYEDPLL